MTTINIFPIIAFLALLLAIIIGAIILQIYLSKKENGWLWLILPILMFAVSLTVLWGMRV